MSLGILLYYFEGLSLFSIAHYYCSRFSVLIKSNYNAVYQDKRAETKYEVKKRELRTDERRTEIIAACKLSRYRNKQQLITRNKLTLHFKIIFGGSLYYNRNCLPSFYKISENTLFIEKNSDMMYYNITKEKV